MLCKCKKSQSQLSIRNHMEDEDSKWPATQYLFVGTQCIRKCAIWIAFSKFRMSSKNATSPKSPLSKPCLHCSSAKTSILWYSTNLKSEQREMQNDKITTICSTYLSIKFSFRIKYLRAHTHTTHPHHYSRTIHFLSSFKTFSWSSKVLNSFAASLLRKQTALFPF